MKFLLAILLLSSCNQNAELGRNDVTHVPKGITTQTIDDAVIDQIVEYYFERFADYDETYNLEKNFSDTVIELYYSSETISSGHTVYIGIKPENLVYGDLNNDGTSDLAMGLYNEYGGSGSNTDVFVFLNENGRYSLASAISAYDVSPCEVHYFLPLKIEKGELLGTSLCYAELDPQCCPSLEVATVLGYQNGKLELIRKE